MIFSLVVLNGLVNLLDKTDNCELYYHDFFKMTIIKAVKLLGTH